MTFSVHKIQFVRFLLFSKKPTESINSKQKCMLCKQSIICTKRSGKLARYWFNRSRSSGISDRFHTHENIVWESFILIFALNFFFFSLQYCIDKWSDIVNSFLATSPVAPNKISSLAENKKRPWTTWVHFYELNRNSSMECNWNGDQTPQLNFGAIFFAAKLTSIEYPLSNIQHPVQSRRVFCFSSSSSYFFFHRVSLLLPNNAALRRSPVEEKNI